MDIGYLIHTRSDKTFKGTVLNQTYNTIIINKGHL